MKFESFIVFVIVVVFLIFVLYKNVCSDGHLVGSSETLPVFLRSGDDRILVSSAPKVQSNVVLPKNFDSRKHWKGLISGVTDQGACGSCWAFSAATVFTDRIKIASRGRDLKSGDFISQYKLAACIKCNNTTGICKKVCDGHYMDEVLTFLQRKGAHSNETVKRFSKTPKNYTCVRIPQDQGKIFKAKSGLRVNPFSFTQLRKGSPKLKMNEESIMYEIFKRGPVTATIKVYEPLRKKELHKNFYYYKSGIFGQGWKKEPKEYDGYHAISIIGWGEANSSKDKVVKYWIIRNSWGTEWGNKGYGKVLRGTNLGIIESDCWAPVY